MLVYLSVFLVCISCVRACVYELDTLTREVIIDEKNARFRVKNVFIRGDEWILKIPVTKKKNKINNVINQQCNCI